LVAVEMPSRASNAALTDDSREARDIEISLGSARDCDGGDWEAFVGIWRRRVKIPRVINEVVVTRAGG
jgi:hypothetical protein